MNKQKIVMLNGMDVIANPKIVSKDDSGKGMPVVPNKPQVPKPSAPKQQPKVAK
jgi:hypothetical protein